VNFFSKAFLEGPSPIISFVPGKFNFKNASTFFSGETLPKNVKIGVCNFGSAGVFLFFLNNFKSIPSGTITPFLILCFSNSFFRDSVLTITFSLVS